jgi:uncharacterized phage-like protein YoqJ
MSEIRNYIVLPIERYFSDKYAWKYVNFDDMTKEEFDRNVELYWNNKTPEWINAYNLAWWGQFSIMRYLDDQLDYTKDRQHLIDLAAGYGNLNFVKWLHFVKHLNCTTDAMDFAAIDGYLDVIKWLHENRTEGCTKMAMTNAIVEDHLDVVQFLYDNRNEGCNQYAIDKMMEKPDSNVYKWFNENKKRISKVLHSN